MFLQIKFKSYGLYFTTYQGTIAFEEKLTLWNYNKKEFIIYLHYLLKIIYINYI